MTVDQRIVSDVERFQELLDLRPGADLQMVLLKAHLLIEELLQSFLEHSVINGALLADARLSFHQRLLLAQALHPDPSRFDTEWVWSSVRALNSLRNQMVHNIEPKEFDAQLDRFTDTVEHHLPFPVTPGTGSEYRLAKCGSMLSFLNVYLARLLRSALPPTPNDGG
jgi:hypothetical protein